MPGPGSQRRAARRRQRALNRRNGRGGFQANGRAGTNIVRGGQPVREAGYTPRLIQSAPNTFKTWMVLTVNGYIPSGTAAGNYGAALSYAVAPFTDKGGAANVFPNNSGGNATGLLNWLVNSTTGTGLYEKVVIKKTRVLLTVIPASVSDTTVHALSVVNRNNLTYTSVSDAEDGPNSTTKLVQQYLDRRGNTLSLEIDHASLFGLTPQLWRIQGAGTGSPTVAFVTPPLNDYLIWTWAKISGGNTAADIAYQCRVEHDVELFQRCDVSLED